MALIMEAPPRRVKGAPAKTHNSQSLRAGAPGIDHRQQVVDVDGAVAAGRGDVAGAAAEVASPMIDDVQHIVDVDLGIAGHVAGARNRWTLAQEYVRAHVGVAGDKIRGI